MRNYDANNIDNRAKFIMSTYAGLGYIGEESELDATYIRRDVYVAKGQIGTYNTATSGFDLLPPGPNGYVLSSDSLSTYGLTWIAVPSDLDSVATRQWGAASSRVMGVADNVIIGHAASASGRSLNVVIGSGAIASGADQITAVGWQAGALSISGNGCCLYGSQASTAAGVTNGIAIGSAAFVNGNNGISIGGGSSCGTDGVSIGAFTTALRNTLVGNLTLSSNDNCTMMGYSQRTGAGASGSIFYGYTNGNTSLTGVNNLFVGSSILTASATTANNNICIGRTITAFATSTAGAICISSNATVADSSIAIGNSVATNALQSIAIGALAQVSSAGTNSICLGTSATSTAASGVCIGHLAKQAASQQVVIGYNAGNASGTNNSNGVIIGLGAGVNTNGGQNTLVGSGTNSSNLRTDVTALGYAANSTQSFCTIVGSGCSSTAANSNAFGYDVDVTTSNRTQIGNNKSADHVVFSEGLFESVNVSHCQASGAGQVIAAGPLTATLSTEMSSYPAGLFDNANDWIYLSPAGTSAANKVYHISATIDATAAAVGSRHRVSIYLIEPGVGAGFREIAFGILCAGTATSCQASLAITTKIGAVTSRPYVYVSVIRTAGGTTITLDNIYLSFHRVA